MINFGKIGLISVATASALMAVPSSTIMFEHNSTVEDTLIDAVTNADNGNVIVIDGEITHSSGQISIDKNLTIKGDDKTLDIINADGTSAGLFELKSGNSLTIQNLTIKNAINKATNGKGGVIEANSSTTITITNSIFSDNNASFGGAIYIDGNSTLTLTSSTFSDNNASYYGGAINIEDNSTIEITDSTFLNNIASSGSAIYADVNSSMEITNSTFSNNRSLVEDSSNSDSDNYGGTVTLLGYNYDGLKVTNSTFSDNNATIGGAILCTTNLIVTDSTFSDNNSSYAGGAIAFTADENSSINSAGLNLLIENSTFSNNNAFIGGAVVIGGEDSNLTVTNSTFSDNNSTMLGGAIGSIYEINGTIKITGSTFSNNGVSGEDSSNDNRRELSLGFGAGGAIGVMLGIGVDMTIENSTFSNNSAGEDGGAVSFKGEDSSFIVNNSTFSGNVAGEDGGAIRRGAFMATYLSNSTITNSTFSNNIAGEDGGAIRHGSFFGEDSNLTITDSTFSNNIAGEDGGAIDAISLVGGEDNFIKIENSTFSENNSSNFGGTIIMTDSELSLINSTISNSKVSKSGGAIAADNSVVDIENSTLSNNSAAEDGGAIYTYDANLTLINSTLSNNSASNKGGAIMSRVSSDNSGRRDISSPSYIGTEIENSTITQNSSTDSVLYVEQETDERRGGVSSIPLVYIENTILAGNSNSGCTAFSSYLTSEYNIVDSSSCGSSSTNVLITSISDVINTSLANNGGSTLTHNLVNNSIAINAGNPNFTTSLLSKDQRGQNRILFSIVDIGAVESTTDIDSDGDGVVDSSDSCPDTVGNQANGCYVAPVVSNDLMSSDSNLATQNDNVKVQVTENETGKIFEATLTNDGGGDTFIKLDTPNSNNTNTNQDLKKTLTIDNSTNTTTNKTTIQTDTNTDVTVKQDGTFQASKSLNDGSNTKLLLTGDKSGNIEVSSVSNNNNAQTSTKVEIPTGSSTEITKDGSVLSQANMLNSDGSASLKVDISLIQGKAEAVVTSSSGEIIRVSNYNGSTESIMSFIKAEGIQRVVGSNNNRYRGVKNTFKSTRSFFASKGSLSRATDYSNKKTVEIIPTTMWQKFEEVTLFDGKRSIKLILGGADIVIDGERSAMVKDEEYLLPLEIENITQESNTSEVTNPILNPIYENNSLKLTKGWSLVSSPINKELNVTDVFGTNDVTYKFENNSWIKNPKILKQNEGMWVKYNFNIYVHFNEVNSTESYEFNSTILNSGWNLVGTGADINLNSNDYKIVWAFDNIDKTWVSNPSQILRGYGFWIKK